MMECSTSSSLLPPTRGNHWSFTLSMALPSVSYGWNHSRSPFQIGFIPGNLCLRFLWVLRGLRAHALSLLSNIPPHLSAPLWVVLRSRTPALLQRPLPPDPALSIVWPFCQVPPSPRPTPPRCPSCSCLQDYRWKAPERRDERGVSIHSAHTVHPPS